MARRLVNPSTHLQLQLGRIVFTELTKCAPATGRLPRLCKYVCVRNTHRNSLRFTHLSSACLAACMHHRRPLASICSRRFRLLQISSGPRLEHGIVTWLLFDSHSFNSMILHEVSLEVMVASLPLFARTCSLVCI